MITASIMALQKSPFINHNLHVVFIVIDNDHVYYIPITSCYFTSVVLPTYQKTDITAETASISVAKRRRFTTVSAGRR
jgi:hypothetical protein